jgi:uncharacterized protein with PIN domain
VAPPAFLADAMLGRLARWLRLMGYDTAYADRMPDPQIAARARAEGRVVLTRDRGLTRRKGIRCFFVHSQVLEEQIREVVAAFGVPTPRPEPRCPECNVPLIERTPEQAAPYVPPYVFQTQQRFHHCPACERHYWAGTHWSGIEATIARALEGGL